LICQDSVRVNVPTQGARVMYGSFANTGILLGLSVSLARRAEHKLRRRWTRFLRTLHCPLSSHHFLSTQSTSPHLSCHVLASLRPALSHQGRTGMGQETYAVKAGMSRDRRVSHTRASFPRFQSPFPEPTWDFINRDLWTNKLRQKS